MSYMLGEGATLFDSQLKLKLTLLGSLLFVSFVNVEATGPEAAISLFIGFCFVIRFIVVWGRSMSIRNCTAPHFRDALAARNCCKLGVSRFGVNSFTMTSSVHWASLGLTVSLALIRWSRSL